VSGCKARPGTREIDVQQAIRLALGLEPGLVLFRNNVGAMTHPGSTRPVHYGVGGKGGSDLIGLLTIEVSTVCDPDAAAHVCLGHTNKLARFVALEVKKHGGRVSADQWAFIELVRAHGGFAAIVFSVEEAKDAIARARRGEVG